MLTKDRVVGFADFAMLFQEEGGIEGNNKWQWLTVERD
jgi:hypothetical protein